MNKAICKHCGKHSNFFLTVGEKDKNNIPQSIVLCKECFAKAEINPLFGNLKRPPKNGDLIND